MTEGFATPQSACSVDSLLPSRIDSNFASWKEVTHTNITTLLQSPTVTAGNASAGEMTSYQNLQKEVFNTLACLQEKMGEGGSTTNQIHAAQVRILELQEQLNEREEEIQIAKDRVAYLRDPDAHPSYYQSWFPMDHPMRPTSVPIFIGIVVFFTMLIVLALLSMMGLNLSIGSGIPGAPPSALALAVQWIRTQFTLPFWILLASLIGVVVVYRR